MGHKPHKDPKTLYKYNNSKMSKLKCQLIKMRIIKQQKRNNSRLIC